jgi:hypothetical protein
VEDIDHRAARGLDKSVVRALTQESAWVAQHENIFVASRSSPRTTKLYDGLNDGLTWMNMRR